MLGAFIIGAIAFVAGFIGPIILQPKVEPGTVVGDIPHGSGGASRWEP